MRISQAYYLRQSHLAARRRPSVRPAMVPVPMVRPSVLGWCALGSVVALWCGILVQSAIAAWGGL